MDVGHSTLCTPLDYQVLILFIVCKYIYLSILILLPFDWGGLRTSICEGKQNGKVEMLLLLTCHTFIATILEFPSMGVQSFSVHHCLWHFQGGFNT